MKRISVIGLIVLMFGTPITAMAQSVTPAASPSAASGDFAGLVDIGGRNIYLGGRGEGSPTVLLVAGYLSSARFWTDDLLHPDAPRTMVTSVAPPMRRTSSSSRCVEPMPAGPLMSTRLGRPSAACWSAPPSSANSRSRPTNDMRSSIRGAQRYFAACQSDGSTRRTASTS